MKRLIPLGVLLALACTRTPTTSEMPDGMAEATFVTMDKLTAELGAIRDRESWLKSQSRIAALAEEMKAERVEGNRLTKMNLPTRQKMEEKYADRMAESSAALKAQLERIVREVDQGKDYVRRIENLLKDKLKEANDSKESK